jgi:hypothetical protein
VSFVQRAQDLGVPVHYEDYTFGTHSWPYWARDLREYIGPMMQTFAHPPAAPATTSYQSIDKSWSQWGWSVTVNRPEAQQFSSLADGRREGFTLQGTGTARVATPPLYRPGSVATVTFANTSGPPLAPATAVADASGRLHLTVRLSSTAVPDAVGSPAVIGVPLVPPWGGTTTVSIAAE